MLLAVGLALIAVVSPGLLTASDHDDGEVELKGRNLNLTDLYAFREIDQNPNAFQSDLIFIMNTNPRSVARQQYFFSTVARYEFKVERVVNNNDIPTADGLAVPDVTLRFEFGEPAANGQQQITVTAIRGHALATASGGLTTVLNMAPVTTEVSLFGSTLRVFAGLREDPFFFDVESFFRVRAAALSVGPPASFRNPGFDFAAGYNVNAIIVRVPVAFLQGGTAATSFDVWETISVGSGDDFAQLERVAQPAINEGLIRTNAFLNTLNMVGPEVEAEIMASPNPLANPIIAEAAGTLLAFGNTVPQAVAIARAFLADVLRIDTAAPSGYAAAVNSLGRPIRGRKILDDVIDITLSVVVPVTPPLKDNVSYNGPNAGGTGHKPLLPTFPYLPAPN
jgi:hypothetical protein